MQSKNANFTNKVPDIQRETVILTLSHSIISRLYWHVVESGCEAKCVQT